MKTILFSLLFAHTLFAFGDNIQTFEAHFTQTITDETGKKLVYKGEMHTKRPYFVLWNYTEPARAAKKLYLNRVRAVLVQPLLEQATVSQLNNDMNFFEIISSAKKVDENHYKARYKDIDFTLTEENGVIQSLAYQDELENHILITFSKQRQNRPIEDDLFTPKVPQDYDIIQNHQ